MKRAKRRSPAIDSLIIDSLESEVLGKRDFKMPFANIRRIMLKHKRGAKCPLLEKFLSLCVEEAKENFISTAEIFEAYKSAVSVWTDQDSVRGQTQFLMKRNSFNQVRVGISSEQCLCP